MSQRMRRKHPGVHERMTGWKTNHEWVDVFPMKNSVIFHGYINFFIQQKGGMNEGPNSFVLVLIPFL